MKFNPLYLYIIFCLALTACSLSEDTADVDPQQQLILSVQSADRLYTTEYVVHKVVTYDDVVRLRGEVLSKKFDLKIPQPTRKVLIPMEARIKAYIDFSSFGSQNVAFGADSTVRVTLPDPEVVLTSSKINHAGVREYVDYGRSRFSSAELADYESQGRAAIIASIPQMGILDTARMHAYNFMVPLLENMGYTRDKITIEFSHNISDANYIQRLITSAAAQ